MISPWDRTGGGIYLVTYLIHMNLVVLTQWIMQAYSDMDIYPMDFKMYRDGKGANPREHR
ncbi:hypothetical protein AM629_12065 [Photorhabdus heterorhabditis]|uniref:Uncharacterized protein n=1 Tax=Photorhabdus heterorhabditis TaxID=880156 RepID=A0ABR5KB27_9GAMM|nr:hypothetical protein AM629_12065 [Photorhabdus heterorhabditis]